MRFLITNDDGFDGPGLAALYHALKPLGEVVVVAPLVCHSAKGHAVNTKTPIEVQNRDVDPFGPIHIVDASPADCVRIALRAVMDQPPDFVIAGINTGANLGVDLFYSGTAAAAREAAIMGVPSIALSRYFTPQCKVNWKNLATHTSRVIQTLTGPDHKLPEGQFWNVNFPAVAADEHSSDVKFTHMGTKSHDVQFQEVESRDGVRRFQYTGDYRQRGQSEDCDVGMVFREHTTITPIHLCQTAKASLPQNT